MKNPRITLTPEKIERSRRIISDTVLEFRVLQLRGSMDGLNSLGRDNVIRDNIDPDLLVEDIFSALLEKG